MAPTSSEIWWNGIVNEPDRLLSWLVKQYNAEATAGERIRSFADTFSGSGSAASRILHKVAEQEDDHAEWVSDLLFVRGVDATDLQRDERYWDKIMPPIVDFQDGSAMAALVERKGLERIRAITDSPETPHDVRVVFEKILPQEVFHERAFASLAGDHAMQAAVEARLIIEREALSASSLAGAC